MEESAAAGHLVLLTDKLIVGISAADGKLLWQVPFAPQGRAYNAATPIVDGQTAWTDGAKLSTFGSLVDAGPAILALPESGDLIVFKADASAYSEVARYKVAESAVYAHPVLSGKRIFVKDADSVALWMVE